jgi:hypothetical protein
MSAHIQEPAQPHSRDRRLVWAVVLLAPAVVFVTASILQYGAGVPKAADWFNPLFTLKGVELITTTWVVGGPVVAFLLAASRVFPIRLVRDDDEETWDIRLRVRIDWPAIMIGGASLLYGGFLIGHLLAENAACMIGVRSMC